MISKRAHEIMIPIDRYPNIFHNFSLKQAVAELEAAVISFGGRKSLPRALLVIDENHNLLGIIRRRDILRGLEPKFMQKMPHHHQKELLDIEGDPDLVYLSSGKVVKSMQAQAERPVKDYMRPVEDTVDYDEHIAKIIYKMVSRDLNLLPVMKDKKVVGVVRSVDVFHEVANLIL